jgi:N-acetylglucosaminyl-diphospho-decaprenol L-rhamnosyltransferase
VAIRSKNSEPPTVYVPTLDGGDRLRQCLDSLHRQTVATNVVVADNSDGDGCTEMLGESFPEVTRVGFGRNLGFGMALNRAVATVGDGPIVLLNDDAIAGPDFVEQLLGCRDRAEMVAAVLLSERDPTRIDSAGVVVDQTLMGFDYLLGESVDSLSEALPPMGPTGGAALYNRAAFTAVGGFDERIFLYYEDVDLALRMRRNGATCAFCPQARAIHGYSATLGSRTGNKYAMTGWSRGYLLRRYGVMQTPSLAAQAILREGIVCGGQLIGDRTVAGLKGRVRGWRAAKGLTRRSVPDGALTELSLGEAISLRRRRHDA